MWRWFYSNLFQISRWTMGEKMEILYQVDQWRCFAPSDDPSSAGNPILTKILIDQASSSSSSLGPGRPLAGWAKVDRWEGKVLTGKLLTPCFAPAALSLEGTLSKNNMWLTCHSQTDRLPDFSYDINLTKRGNRIFVTDRQNTPSMFQYLPKQCHYWWYWP